MTRNEWRIKLHKEIDDYWRLNSQVPKAIYMGHEEWYDFRANIPPFEYNPNGDLTFEDIEIINVHKNNYFRVI